MCVCLCAVLAWKWNPVNAPSATGLERDDIGDRTKDATEVVQVILVVGRQLSSPSTTISSRNALDGKILSLSLSSLFYRSWRERKKYQPIQCRTRDRIGSGGKKVRKRRNNNGYTLHDHSSLTRRGDDDRIRRKSVSIFLRAAEIQQPKRTEKKEKKKYHFLFFFVFIYSDPGMHSGWTRWWWWWSEKPIKVDNPLSLSLSFSLCGLGSFYQQSHFTRESFRLSIGQPVTILSFFFFSLSFILLHHLAPIFRWIGEKKNNNTNHLSLSFSFTSSARRLIIPMLKDGYCARAHAGSRFVTWTFPDDDLPPTPTSLFFWCVDKRNTERERERDTVCNQVFNTLH